MTDNKTSHSLKGFDTMPQQLTKPAFSTIARYNGYAVAIVRLVKNGAIIRYIGFNAKKYPKPFYTQANELTEF